QKFGLSREEQEEQEPRQDLIPFESQRQYMATLHDKRGGGRIAYVKGSLEALLQRGEYMLSGSGHREPLDPEIVGEHAERLAQRGLRVLALGFKELDAEQTQLCHDDVDTGVTLLGLQGIIDPPREEAKKA